MKKLWPEQVRKEIKLLSRNKCRDISRLCRDKASEKVRRQTLSRQSFIMSRHRQKQAKRQTSSQQSFIMSRQSQKISFVATKFYYVSTKPKTSQKTNFVTKKFYYVTTKPEFRDIVLGLTRSDIATQVLKKNQKAPKIVILAYFQAHFHPRTINTHFLFIFEGKGGGER